jgi:hypothetical protein
MVAKILVGKVQTALGLKLRLLNSRLQLTKFVVLL